MTRAARLALVVVLSQCDQSMDVQQRAEPNQATSALPGGITARLPPQGTVSRGNAAYLAALRAPPKATLALLARGRERYDIFCSECHGYTGDGDGMVVQRGYPHPPSFHSSEARAEGADQLLATIGDGKGAMFPYATQIAPADRWAIVAYIRALQLQRRSPASAGRTP